MSPLSSFRRRAGSVAAVSLSAVSLGVAFSAPSPATASSTGWVTEACQYSFDQYWRQVPVEIVGTLVDAGSGVEIPPNAALAPGTRVRLADATVDAVLPDWIKTFATEGGFIPLGEGEIPLDGWVALEGVNTKEGVAAPTPFSTKVRTSIVNGAGGTVDEQASILDVIPAPIASPTWTLSGGTLNVRQALATAMGEVPEGRDGARIKVNGSLFVRATLGAGSSSVSQLFIDCLHGDQVPLNVGATHTDALPTPVRNDIRVAGFAGNVDGTPLATAVDAELSTSALPRAGAGIATTLTSSTLTVRLTSAQSAAWLGTSGNGQVTGVVPLSGAGSTVAQQTAAIVPQPVSATGAATTIALPLENTTWTPVGTTGVAVRADDRIRLTARIGGTDRVLTLDRDTAVRAAGDAYPFGQILGPDPRTRFDGGGSAINPDNPPPLGGGGLLAPPPAVTKRATVKIASSTLKRSTGKLKVKLTNLSKTATTKGRFKLVTTSKYTLGTSKKKRTITLVAAKSFALKKGKSTTYTVKLTKDATTLLRTRKTLKAKLTVTPSSAKTQKTVTRTVTVKR